MTISDATPTPTPTTGTIQIATRRFKIGTTVLADPDPTLPPQKVIELYSASYPFLRSSTLNDPILDDDGKTLVYEIIKPAVQTKGAKAKPLPKAISTAIGQLQSWATDATVPAHNLPERWTPVVEHLQRCLKKPTHGLDAFLLPMA